MPVTLSSSLADTRSSNAGRRLRERSVRALLVLLAVAFAAWTVLYSICWMIAVRPAPVAVELGFNAPTFLPGERALLVDAVSEGSPAERAGIRPGDRIVEIDGKRLENAESQVSAWRGHKPGDPVVLRVVRTDAPGGRLLTGYFRAVPQPGGFLGTQIRNWMPVPFVAVGLAVLFLRLEDRNVWLLALLLAAFPTISGFPNRFAAVPVVLRPFVRLYCAVFLSSIGPLFYWLFTVFPARAPLERRMPWLKWAAVAFGLWMGLFSVFLDRLELPVLGAWLGDSDARGPFWFEFAFLVLGIASLATTFVQTRDTQAKRRIRVLFWGTAVGIAPGLVNATLSNMRIVVPAWAITAQHAIAFLFPLSFAYAVVKYRVLDIPWLLQRSARYLLVQRGFALLLSGVSIGLTLLFAFSLAARLQPVVDVAGPTGIVLGAVFGTLVLSGGLRLHRQVSERIDRAFFRSAYDARMILEDLAEQARKARTREELAHLLERHLEDALKPTRLIVYLAEAGRLVAVSSAAAPAIRSNLLADILERAEPWEVAPSDGGNAVAALSPLADLAPECLVPILGRGRRLAGLVVLGPRLSEEPYSGEDKRLLASVAAQAGIALDNMRFAEELAERIEKERSAAREMEIARDVQSRLLPQSVPQVRTLDCAARCLQARSVGGDYYDFLDLGSGRAAVVLADVSGKGVHAALLSASLQAHLRSQAALAPLDPARMLGRVNDILWKSTAAQHYATLFFGIYDDGSRCMQYVNCGHIPPILLRSDGTVERLLVTAPVVGLFDQWACTTAETHLRPGDMLAVFSDGISEAMHGDEEFGEARLIEQLRPDGRSAAQTVDRVLASVQAFSGGEQSDDLTLVVGRAT